MNADASWAARHDDATTTIASFITMIAGTRYSTFLVAVSTEISRVVCLRKVAKSPPHFSRHHQSITRYPHEDANERGRRGGKRWQQQQQQ